MTAASAAGMPTMRHAQLRAFHHVALCGGFSRAAERLHLTQPAVSDQVRRLETEYDILLFDRSGRGAALTARGRQLFDHTNRLFAAEADAREFLTETKAELSGCLRLMVDSAVHVAGILSRFQREHPRLSVRLKSGNTEAVIRSLLDYEADIGVGGNFPEGAGLEEMTLGTSPVVAIVAETHDLASRGSVTFGELARFPLLLRESGSKTRQIGEAAAAENGIDLEGITTGLSALHRLVTGDEARMARVRELGAAYLDARTGVLLHGDFYPGSWLRHRDGPKVIDPEFAFVGPPEFDVGVLLAHLVLTGHPARVPAAYRPPTGFDRGTANGFAGVEILRRLLGVAQLPLEADIQTKGRWIDQAAQLLAG